MVRRLRAGERVGFLFANGGHCSHNHSIVLRSDPAGQDTFPHDYHVQHLADAARRIIPELPDEIEGDLPVEPYTVFYDRSGEPETALVVSRAKDGRRIIARVDPADRCSMVFLTDGKVEPVGQLGGNAREGEYLIWSAP